MEENDKQDLKVVCQTLMVNDNPSREIAPYIHVLIRMANIHARALGYRDWVDAYHKL